jgi:protein O-GlcNAc transferase
MSQVLRARRFQAPKNNNRLINSGKLNIRSTLEAAVALHQEGRLDEAEGLYEKVLKIAPNNADALQFLGVIAHQRGNNERAVELLNKALRCDPDNLSCHNNLGNIYCAIDDLEKAAIHFAKAAGSDTPPVEALRNLAVLQRRKGDMDEARKLLRRAYEQDSQAADVLHDLAELELQLQEFAAAEALYRRYVVIRPADTAAKSNLAYAVQQQGRMEESDRLFQDLMQQAADVPEFGYNARLNLILQGRFDEAERLLREALEKEPNMWITEAALASNISARGYADRAIEQLSILLKVLPDNADVWTNIGLMFVNMQKLDRAIPTLTRAIELDPDCAVAHNSLGCAYLLSGYPTLAIPSFKASVKANPDFVEPYSNLCRALRAAREYDQANVYGYLTLNHRNYKQEKSSPNVVQVFKASCDFRGLEQAGNVWDLCDGLPVDSLPPMFLDLLAFAEQPNEIERFVGLVRRWAEARETHLEAFPKLAPAEGSGAEKLRIGFLSSDFRTHSVARFLTPLMQGYDKSRFEYYCYTSINVPQDPKQQLFRNAVDHFRIVEHKSNWDIARTIREDNIDILFELNGFTEHSMIGAMPFKPAPVQVSWLGYPFTCGLRAIDHVVLDRFVAPESGKYLVEEPILMPDAWVCFGNFDEVAVADVLPMDRAGRVTFGTLNNPYKFTPRMIANWARAMQAVPESRFLMVRPEACSTVICRNLAEEFARNGIASDRLFLFDNTTEKASHLSYYNEIDISLDTFPLTGGTTTCEATWMGVPVVSLVGEAFHQRISYSALMQCGLEELCTFDDETFVARAIELAGSREKLLDWRQGMRETMTASPLCDHEKFIHQFQEMLEQVAAYHKLR